MAEYKLSRDSYSQNSGRTKHTNGRISRGAYPDQVNHKMEDRETANGIENRCNSSQTPAILSGHEGNNIHDKYSDETTIMLQGDGKAKKVSKHRDEDKEVHDPPSIEDDNHDDGLMNVPIDRGWAWVVLAAAFFEVFIFGGMMKSFGIFFIAYQERFHASSSEVSLILTISNLTTSFTGIFVMTIGMKYMSARLSIIIGSVMVSLSYILTAYAEHIGILYFTVGFIQGVAAGMIFLPIVTMINIYFNKYRGLANSLSMCGSSLGGLAGGPFYSTLFANYGYTGTTLIQSGIMLNIVISGCLMRPLEFYSNRRKVRNCVDKHNNGVDKHDDKESVSVRLLAQCNNAEDPNLMNSVNEYPKGASATENKRPSVESAYGSEDLDIAAKFQNTVNSEASHMDSLPGPRNKDDFNINIRTTQNSKKGTNAPFNRTISYDPETLAQRGFPSPSLKRMKQGPFGSHILKQPTDESIEFLRNRTFSERSQGRMMHAVVESISRSRVALYTSADVVCGSMANVCAFASGDEVFKEGDLDRKKAGTFTSKAFSSSNDELNALEVKGSSGICFSLKFYIVNFLKTVFDISLLRSPVFLHYLAFAALILPGSVMPTIYFAPYAKEIGLSPTEIGTMFSIIGCLDTVARIGVGVIADKQWMQGTSIMVVTATIIGTASHLVRFVTTYWTLMILVVLIGLFCGAYMSLYAVIMVKHMGTEKFKGSLGWANMCHGVTMASFFPLTGYLRDKTGSYYATFHLIGATLYIGAVLSFLLPYTSKRHKSS